jgi:oligoribonuclease NrnB/cAMP/cGMP phosphodiesterase (DHH superfamily)
MKIIFVEDLAEMEEDQIVTDILEHLLENGNLFAFEHGYEYLIKYDQEFIQPYIERYAQGDYNKAELKYINNLRYRNDYIQNIAKSVVTQ